jgi:hypothetical protein
VGDVVGDNDGVGDGSSDGLLCVGMGLPTVADSRHTFGGVVASRAMT